MQIEDNYLTISITDYRNDILFASFLTTISSSNSNLEPSMWEDSLKAY